jgi:hypothetical protein
VPQEFLHLPKVRITPSRDEKGEQDSGGNGGQRPSFASLWTPDPRRATLMTFGLSMRARVTFIVCGLVGVVALAVVLPAVQVCRDWAFVDLNTGSRNGYREWPFGWRSGSWYQESVIEAFMRSNYPAEFQQDWVSYAGTGRNVFGGATLHGHGRPGPIIRLIPEVFDPYWGHASEAEKRRLYDVFSGGDEEQIQNLVDDIYEAAMPERHQKTEASGGNR